MQRSSAVSPECPKGGCPKSCDRATASAMFFVQAHNPADGTGDLRHLEGVGQPRAIIVSLVLHKHLRLMLQAAECGGMDDAVAVALITASGRTLLFGAKTAAAFLRA